MVFFVTNIHSQNILSPSKQALEPVVIMERLLTCLSQCHIIIFILLLDIFIYNDEQYKSNRTIWFISNSIAAFWVAMLPCCFCYLTNSKNLFGGFIPPRTTELMKISSSTRQYMSRTIVRAKIARSKLKAYISIWSSSVSAFKDVFKLVSLIIF